jgi:hypothetical protein
MAGSERRRRPRHWGTQATHSQSSSSRHPQPSGSQVFPQM